MGNIKMMKDSLVFHGDTATIDLYYPDAEDNEINKIEVGLMDVRAADNIRISYDKDRDGWVVEQASTFQWPDTDPWCDPDWWEVSFIKAWGRTEDTEGKE